MPEYNPTKGQVGKKPSTTPQLASSQTCGLRHFKSAPLVALIVLMMLTAGCNLSVATDGGSSSSDADGASAASDRQCVRTEPGDSWSSVTRKLGLDPGDHWSDVSDANPKAGNEDILFAETEVCLTADQRDSIVGASTTTEATTAPDATSVQTSSSVSEATTTTVEVATTTTEATTTTAKATSTTARLATTTTKAPADVELYIDSPYFNRIKHDSGCTINVYIDNDGPDDAENVVVTATVASPGAVPSTDFELVGPSTLRAGGRPMQYGKRIALTVFDHGYHFSVDIRVEVDGLQEASYESRSDITCPNR